MIANTNGKMWIIILSSFPLYSDWIYIATRYNSKKIELFAITCFNVGQAAAESSHKLYIYTEDNKKWLMNVLYIECLNAHYCHAYWS